MFAVVVFIRFWGGFLLFCLFGFLWLCWFVCLFVGGWGVELLVFYVSFGSTLKTV